MKKIIILIIISVFLFSGLKVQAKLSDDLPGLEIMPDSPFYFLKIWYEKIILFFTFDSTKKAERYKTFAEKRIYEIKKMLEKGKESLAKKSEKIYKSYLNKAKKELEKAIRKAVEQKKEDLKQELERKAEEIKIKIEETINLW